MTDISAQLIAQVRRDLEELESSAAAAANLPPSRRRGESGISAVFTVRLDRDELSALERRAKVVGLKPSVLARNLIRAGLAHPGDQGVSAALDRLEAAMDELRALVA